MELKQDETGKAVVPVLACVLKQLCDRNDRLPVSGKTISKFHAQRPPAITIFDYLHRISRYALCSGECFVLALVYVDRIIQQNPQFVVNSLNIHRLLITSVMLAAKFFDDQYFNNAYYAKVGGVPPNEMNSLEVEFLFMTNFSLFVTTDTYRQYYQELWNHAQSSSVCGCASAKVPGLLLAFEAEERERRKRVKQMRQAQADDGDGDEKGPQKALQGSVDDGASAAGSAEPEAMTDSPPSRPQAASRPPSGKQEMVGSIPGPSQNGGSEPRAGRKRHGLVGQGPAAMVASSPVGVG